MFNVALCIGESVELRFDASSSDDATFVAREWVRGNESRTAFVSITGNGPAGAVLLAGWTGNGENASGVIRCPLRYAPDGLL